MRLTSVPFAVTALLAAGLGEAQYLINELSFGHTGRISRPEAPYQIPHFDIVGRPRNPEVLSNKVILTPISAGNHRAAVWGNTPLTHTSWEADIDFRANGPERGGGTLNIWLAKNGYKEIGSNSVYTVEKFDGLVLVIGVHQGQGMLRAFLNDGTTDYRRHGKLDSLAFGHCSFPYRNLGRPSQVKLRHSSSYFKVEVDGKPCFDTDKVRIPAGNYFGVSAITPETPDSFEVFKLAVLSQPDTVNDNKNQNQGNSQKGRQHIPDHNGNKAQAQTDEGFDTIPDADAETFETSKAQFQDLHNRLQLTTHQLSAVNRVVTIHHQMDEQRHDEIKNILGGMKDLVGGFQAMLNKLDQIGDMQRKMNDLERDIQGMRTDLNRKLVSNEQNVKGYLKDHHATLSQTVTNSVPGHGRLIFVFVGLQVLLVGAYLLYKRRKASLPKKYL